MKKDSKDMKGSTTVKDVKGSEVQFTSEDLNNLAKTLESLTDIHPQIKKDIYTLLAVKVQYESQGSSVELQSILPIVREKVKELTGGVVVVFQIQ